MLMVGASSTTGRLLGQRDPRNPAVSHRLPTLPGKFLRVRPNH